MHFILIADNANCININKTSSSFYVLYANYFEQPKIINIDFCVLGILSGPKRFSLQLYVRAGSRHYGFIFFTCNHVLNIGGSFCLIGGLLKFVKKFGPKRPSLRLYVRAGSRHNGFMFMTCNHVLKIGLFLLDRRGLLKFEKKNRA